VLPDGQKLPLPAAQRKHVKPAHELTIGLRPEQISLAGTGTILRAEAELVEALGGEAIVHARIAGNDMLVRTPGRPAISIGGPLTLHLAVDHLHLFDRASGKVLE
jgi:ABC-type sugar transport system ATPase subunit